MIKTLFTLLAPALAAVLVATSPFDWSDTTHDFGRIQESKGSVSHTFTFINTADYPIAIDRVVPSCGCTTPEFTRSLVAPGESGSVTITFEPAGYRGEFSKSIAVISGGNQFRDFLVITGKVK